MNWVIEIKKKLIGVFAAVAFVGFVYSGMCIACIAKQIMYHRKIMHACHKKLLSRFCRKSKGERNYEHEEEVLFGDWLLVRY